MIFTRVRGIPQTRAAFAKAELQIRTASPTAVRAAGEALQRAMSARAPRRTGALASSIGLDVTSSLDGAVARIGADVSYDRFVQRGTRYMEPQAYGEEAADSTTGEIVAAMAAVYKAAIT